LKTASEEEKITVTPVEAEPDETLNGLPAQTGQGTGVALAEGLPAGAETVDLPDAMII
jgi:hypothetical protein